jgi:hypothetical protein
VRSQTSQYEHQESPRFARVVFIVCGHCQSPLPWFLYSNVFCRPCLQFA